MATHLHLIFLLCLIGCSTSTTLESGTLQRESVVSTDPYAVCNDGTSPVYYRRLNQTSTQWLIYLEGGGFCFDDDSCEERYQDFSYLVTGSLHVVPSSLKQAGILSNDCLVNPHFCGANIFYLHYCSSDFWLGRQDYIGEEMAYFQGRAIFLQILSQIFSYYPAIKSGSEIVLSGAATGAVGILGLADLMKEKLQEEMLVSTYKYYAIADSGWYLTGDSMVNYTCTSSQCNLEMSVMLAYTYLNMQFDETCTRRFSDGWKCAFLELLQVAYEIATPIFSTFYLEDSVQLWADGVNKTLAQDFNQAQLDWAKQRDSQTRAAADEIRSYASRHAFYLIDCLHHVVTSQDGQISLLEVNLTSFNDALEMWIDGKSIELIEADCGSKSIACNPNCIANQEISQLPK